MEDLTKQQNPVQKYIDYEEKTQVIAIQKISTCLEEIMSFFFAIGIKNI